MTGAQAGCASALTRQRSPCHPAQRSGQLGGRDGDRGQPPGASPLAMPSAAEGCLKKANTSHPDGVDNGVDALSGVA